MKKQYWIALGLLIAALVLVGSIAALTYAPTPTPIPQAPAASTASAVTVSLTVDGLYENKQVQVTAGETVLELLEQMNAVDPKLALSVKEYANLGTLVVGMDGRTNGTDKKYWQYEVNNVMPQIGADHLQLKDGDTVHWLFDVSKF